MALSRGAFISSRLIQSKIVPKAALSTFHYYLPTENSQATLRKHVFLQNKKHSFVFYRRFSSYPTHALINLPNLSPTMETGTVISWAKKEGDQVGEGDLLAEIETDKATMSLDASDEGFLAKILTPAGAKNVPVGTPLCVIVESEDLVPAFADFQATVAIKVDSPPLTPPSVSPTSTSSPPLLNPVTTPTPPTSPPVNLKPKSSAGGDRIFLSPLARRIATERGIDVSQLGGGSGVDGCIIASDLDNISSLAAPGVMGTSGFSDLPISGMRATIAKRLLESKQTIPHYYLTVDIEIEEMLQLRNQLNATLSKLASGSEKPVKISVNDIIIKAVGHACKSIPDCNSAWHGDFIRQYNSVDVCVAVSTPTGLITPIVFNADSKGLVAISQEIRSLASRAKENKLQPQEFNGGTITLSNLGMYGISSFSAIINPPQACILAVGGSKQSIVPDENAPNGYRTGTQISVTLCCDHRVVDGAVGAQWLSEFKALLECPARMLM